MSYGEATFLLADCNMMGKYADLLNMIFNVRFVERVVELKALIDAQILHMHLHLSPMIGGMTCSSSDITTPCGILLDWTYLMGSNQ